MGNCRAEASLNKRASHSESELVGLDTSLMQGISLQPMVKSATEREGNKHKHLSALPGI